MESKVPEYPLAVGDVQYFGDQLSGPLFRIHPVVSHGQVLILHVEELSGYSPFYDVFQPMTSWILARQVIWGDM